MKKIRYEDESIQHEDESIQHAIESVQHAMMLGNLLAVRYAGSANLDRGDVYRSALALTTGLGLGKATMGQIGDVVADLVAYHSDEGRAERKQKIAEAVERYEKAAEAVHKAKWKLQDAENKREQAREDLNEIGRTCDLDAPQPFGLDDFRFMR